MRTWSRKRKVEAADVLKLHASRREAEAPDLNMLSRATCGDCQHFPSEAWERLESAKASVNRAALEVEELEATRERALGGRNGANTYAELTGKLAKAERTLESAQTTEADCAVAYVEALRAGGKCLWISFAHRATCEPETAACRNYRPRGEAEHTLTCGLCAEFKRWPKKPACPLATIAGQRITENRVACQRFHPPGTPPPPPPHEPIWGSSTRGTHRRIAELIEHARDLQARLDEQQNQGGGGGENAD